MKVIKSRHSAAQADINTQASDNIRTWASYSCVWVCAAALLIAAIGYSQQRATPPATPVFEASPRIRLEPPKVDAAEKWWKRQRPNESAWLTDSSLRFAISRHTFGRFSNGVIALHTAMGMALFANRSYVLPHFQTGLQLTSSTDAPQTTSVVRYVDMADVQRCAGGAPIITETELSRLPLEHRFGGSPKFNLEIYCPKSPRSYCEEVEEQFGCKASTHSLRRRCNWTKFSLDELERNPLEPHLSFSAFIRGGWVVDGFWRGDLEQVMNQSQLHPPTAFLFLDAYYDRKSRARIWNKPFLLPDCDLGMFSLAPALLEFSRSFAHQHLCAGRYVGVHWRRGDLAEVQAKPENVTESLIGHLTKTGLRCVYLASDESSPEVLRSIAEGIWAAPHLGAVIFRFESDIRDDARTALDLSVGSEDPNEIACASKAILALGKVFLGSAGSTFTFHVRVLRHSNPDASNDADIRGAFKLPLDLHDPLGGTPRHGYI